MESSSNLLLTDLAAITIAAAVSMRLFSFLKLPQLLGFIFTGMVLSPVLHVIEDSAAIRELGELGVMFMMFIVGMEFNLDKLKKVFLTSFVGMGVEVAGMLIFGLIVASFMSMSTMAGLFFGGLLSMSSTIVILEILNQRREMGNPYAQISTGILIMEDLFAIFMLVLLVGVSSGKPDLAKLGMSTLSMSAFVIAIFVLGKLVIPYVLKKLALARNPQETVMFTLSMVLGLGFLAMESGMSLALGAFLAGSIISGTFADRHIEQLMTPFRNFFVAIFFVSIGTMISPEQILDMWLPILLITIGMIIFRVAFTFLGVVLAGEKASEAFMTGMCMAPIGEFSFVVAGLGITQGLFNQSVMVITMGVSFLSILLNPFLMDISPVAAKFLKKIAPMKIKALFDIYHDGVSALFSAAGKSSDLQTLVQPMGKIIVYALLFCALIFTAYFANNFLLRCDGLGAYKNWAVIASWAVFTVIAAPIITGMLGNVEIAVERFFSLSAVGLNKKPELKHKVVRFFSGTFSFLIIIGFTVVYMFALAYCLPLGDFSLLGAFVILFACFLMRKKIIDIKTTLEGRFSVVLKRDLQNAVSSQHDKMIERLKNSYKWTVEVSEVDIDEMARVAGKALAELALRTQTGAEVVAIRRGGLVSYNINADTRIFPGDTVVLCGTAQSNEKAEDLLSALQLDYDEQERKVNDNYQIGTYVLDEGSPLISQTLAGVDLNRKYGVKVLAVSRGQRSLMPSANLEFNKEDKILAMGSAEKLENFKREFKLA